MHRAVSLSLALLLGAGCAPEADGVAVAIDVRTDFVPGVEFTGVVVELGDEPVAEVLAVPTRDFLQGTRVAEVSGVTLGTHRFEVILLAASGEELARRPMVVSVTESTAVTVLIARSCRDVVCGAEEACVGGGCASAECSAARPDLCPEPECEAAADCGPPDSPCASALCDDGVCLYEDAGMCTAGEYCDPDFGCRERPTPPPPMPAPRSCADVLARDPDATTGTYTVEPDTGAPVDVFCEMDLMGGGWTRVATIDAASACPSDWESVDAAGVPVCTRPGDSTQAWATYASPVRYTEIAGWVRGLHFGSMDGFGLIGLTGPRGGLSGDYVEGVSITRVGALLEHVWTYAVGWSDTDGSEDSQCPCLGGPAPPAFVGDDFFCESGHAAAPEARWITEDPLWDGDGTGSDCDTDGDPSTFHRTFADPSVDPLMIRILANQEAGNENVGVTEAALFVR